MQVGDIFFTSIRIFLIMFVNFSDYQLALNPMCVFLDAHFQIVSESLKGYNM